LAYNFYLYNPSNLWAFSNHNQIFSQPLHFHESPKFPLSLIKNSTHHLLEINPHLMSLRCMLRPQPGDRQQRNYRVCVCSDVRLNCTNSFTAKLTAQSEQHFIIMLMKFGLQADLPRNLSV